MNQIFTQSDTFAGKLWLTQYFDQFEGRLHYYGNASHGFFDIMMWLQINRPKKKPNIVMPVYIPAKLYRFILAAGYEPRFYDVSKDLNLDLNEISSLIDDDTQLVFAVHFFGVPVDMQPLKQLTEQSGVYLIEDCAHSMNATYKGRLLGSTGDFVLFSTRKMMHLFCGGVLLLNTEPWDFKPSQSEKVRSAFTIYHYAGSRLKYSFNHLLKAYSPFKPSEMHYDGYIDFSEEHVVRVKQMDSFFRWYTNSRDLNEMAETRRKKILYLLNGINDLDLFCPMGSDRYAVREESGHYALHDGFVPFSMPVLMPPGMRNRVQRALSESGVLCFAGWPEAPFGLKGFEGADLLKDRLLELPVHPFINTHSLNLIINCLNALSSPEARDIPAMTTPIRDNSDEQLADTRI